MMLYYWYLLFGKVSYGAHFDSNTNLILRAVPSFSFDERKVYKASHSHAGVEKAAYMCNWAYRLLWRDRASVGQDFRGVHKLYHGLFGDRPARCMVNDSSMECEGTSPESCQRFAGVRIIDQPLHDSSCPSSGCTQLFWDEQSYRSIKGARAVCIDQTDDDMLRYRAASGCTLVVSHVWSHGQGGRPEPQGGSGFNHCLHQRYASIAQAVDGYALHSSRS